MEDIHDGMPMKVLAEPLEGLAAEVQALDPDRPVVEVAFDNIHHSADADTHEFMGQLLAALSGYDSDAEMRFHAMEIVDAQVLDYAGRLLHDCPGNATEISRRASMWLNAVTTYRRAEQDVE